MFWLYGKWNINSRNTQYRYHDTIECNTNSHDAIYSWFHAVRADIDRKPVKYSLATVATQVVHSVAMPDRETNTQKHIRVCFLRIQTTWWECHHYVSNPLYTNLAILNQWYFIPFIPKSIRFIGNCLKMRLIFWIK